MPRWPVLCIHGVVFVTSARVAKAASSVCLCPCLSSQRAKELRREAKRRKREEAHQAAKQSLEASLAESPSRPGPRTRVKVPDPMDTDSDVRCHYSEKQNYHAGMQ